MNLRKILKNLKPGQAILHYNFASLEQFHAGIESVKATGLPLLFGVSEGERAYVGEAAAKTLTAEARKNWPVFLNADHTKSVEKAERVIKLDYDEVLFDGSRLDFQENILATKKVVGLRDERDKNILIEGELGFLPGESELEGKIEMKPEYLTQPDQARAFVEATGVDLLAPSVGNIHGIPDQKIIIDFDRIRKIKAQIGAVEIVLHGGSGLTDEDFRAAIEAGAKIIHLNTEFRKIWKEELSAQIVESTITPYKLMAPVIEKIKERIVHYQKLFWQI